MEIPAEPRFARDAPGMPFFCQTKKPPGTLAALCVDDVNQIEVNRSRNSPFRFPLRSRAELLIVGFHQHFESRTGFFPGILCQGNVTIAFPFARVLTWRFAAAALSLALVARPTGMAFGRRACPGSSTAVFLVSAFALASV